MFIAAVLCLCAAVVTGAIGAWMLTRPPAGDAVREVLRSVAPTQLAAAAMLAAGGAVALAVDSGTGLVLLVICVLGALGTVGAGCWQSAKSVATREAAAPAGACGGGACATCTLSCS
ncbi:hypothetical protein SAMN04489835_1360 [Mycolicibacterium rutilum]|uniref:Transmembrane protein n=1 Tax=Mycolicibacterium rutilum TaxID=370526 RepID=A0A1H6J0L5_MYCRU|nr:hypothetical protein [Mycolicibacterium rutilum]SEH55520.1 hypothetical protein SAMN04489835_1360 [Mycolicibacterium rutilum]